MANIAHHVVNREKLLDNAVLNHLYKEALDRFSKPVLQCLVLVKRHATIECILQPSTRCHEKHATSFSTIQDEQELSSRKGIVTTFCHT